MSELILDKRYLSLSMYRNNPNGGLQFSGLISESTTYKQAVEECTKILNGKIGSAYIIEIITEVQSNQAIKEVDLTKTSTKETPVKHK